MYIYICFILFSLLYYIYSFTYLYKGYASYIHISRGYVKQKRLRTTGLDQWYSTFFVRVPPDIISVQLYTPKVGGV
jgi:hypothetical protein